VFQFLKFFPLLLFWFCTTASSYAATVEESMEFIALSRDFVEIQPSPAVDIDLRYASQNNFTGKNLYGIFNKAYLHHIAGEKLSEAIKTLENLKPGYRLVIYDALRPRSVQKILWDYVKGTEKESYVANPKGGSIHNFGFAVDLSLLDTKGKEVDMGTYFDEFSPLSQPQLEEKFLREGKLSQEALDNRHLLRKIMESAGFIQLPIEWWHFDALPKKEVKEKYKIIE
jgi:D-alanyl-D-alanine dipeptidase